MSVRVEWGGLKFGLVLSGGGAKGAYEAGVFRTLYELGINELIKAVSGTSVGALNTLLFAMGDKELCYKVWGAMSYKTVMVRSSKSDKKSIAKIMRSVSADTGEVTDLNAVMGALAATDQRPYNQSGIKKIICDNADFDRIRNCGKELFVCAYNIDRRTPEYFHLNKLGDDEIVQCVLASSSIPYVFNPVTIRGQKYADGGINNPAFKEKNCDKTPVKPLLRLCLDALIVVYLNQYDKADYSGLKIPVFELYPSKALESVWLTGALNFRRASLVTRMEMGYRDSMTALAPVMAGYLKGTGLDELAGVLGEENRRMLNKRVYQLFEDKRNETDSDE